MNQELTTDAGSQPTRFWAHLSGAATGAANDNFFRLAFMTAIERMLGDDAAAYKPLLGLLFILPMLLMAPTAGTLGDKYSAKKIMCIVRFAEIPLVILGALALMIGSIPMMLIVLSGFGLQTAFYSPVKYASVPDIVGQDKIGKANGSLQAITSLSILGGTALMFLLDPRFRSESFIADWSRGSIALLIGGLLALIGFVATLKIRSLQAHNPDQTIASPLSLRQQFTSLSSQPGVWGPTLTLSAFWALGAIAQIAIIGAAQSIFAFGEAGSALLMVLLGLGTAIGGLSAPLLMVKTAPRALTALGVSTAGCAFGIGCLFAASGSAIATPESFTFWQRAAAVMTAELTGFAIMLLLTGIGAGWWAVSCNTLLQQRADPSKRSLVYSGINIVTNMGIISGFIILLVTATLAIPEIYAAMFFGFLTALGGLIACCFYRGDMLRWILGCVTRAVYRIEIKDEANLPQNGGCVVVANHQSFADGVIVTTCLSRLCRPIMHASYAFKPLRSLFDLIGCITIQPGSGRPMLKAIEAAVEAAKTGQVVVIFAEGKLSRGCDLDTFQKGASRIATRANVPIIPLRIDGLLGSYLSRTAWRRPLSLRRTVTLRLGAAMNATVSSPEIRQQVQHLGFQNAREAAQNDRRTLGQMALCQAKKQPFSILSADMTGSRKRISLCAGAMVMGRHFGLQANEKRVGVLLPPGSAGAATLLALALDGRCAVPLNHTVGDKMLARMAELADLQTIISARAYHSRIGEPTLPGRVVMLEDIKPKISKLAVIWHMIKILLLPSSWFDQADAAEDAAIVFSSGSTGDPKGVRLGHRALIANGEAMMQHLGLSQSGNSLLSPLPLFHSFGLNVGTWLPLCQGVKMISHPDPTDARTIAKLAKTHQPDFFVSTPTFVRGWMRRIEPEDFASLQFGVVGAEACPAALHSAFKERYGAPLMEGYGATELGPVVSVNVPDRSDRDVTEVGTKAGSVGRPMPGIEVVTIDPDTQEILPTGESGLLLIRTPAQMSGYLHQPELTAKVCIHDGYNTGDIGRVDEDGFISLSGRLSRFAKIGGEMVPLDRIEDEIIRWLSEQHPLEDGAQWDVALSAVADPNKGERLMLLYAQDLPVSIKELIDEALANEPALFKPKANSCHQVDALPVLGTGKRDLAALKRLAESLA